MPDIEPFPLPCRKMIADAEERTDIASVEQPHDRVGVERRIVLDEMIVAVIVEVVLGEILDIAGIVDTSKEKGGASSTLTDIVEDRMPLLRRKNRVVDFGHDGRRKTVQ